MYPGRLSRAKYLRWDGEAQTAALTALLLSIQAMLWMRVVWLESRPFSTFQTLLYLQVQCRGAWLRSREAILSQGTASWRWQSLKTCLSSFLLVTCGRLETAVWARERLLSCRMGGKEWGCNSLEWNKVSGQLLDKLISCEGQSIVITRPARSCSTNTFVID